MNLPFLPDVVRWLLHSDDFEFRVREDVLTAVRKEFVDIVERLFRQVKVMQAGLSVAG